MTVPDRLAGALADRYRIERELGAGGMATVYLAHDLKHERRVALKVLKPELAAVLGAERFVVEIKTTAALSHPHILPLFDSGEAGGFLFYVMPFVDGETLRDRLNRETQLGVDEAVRITREIADALHYAHQNGVIHRDIKPENILLQNGRPMVADFGIALAVSAAAGGRMTETGLSLGTPHYMSPEQATAEKEITARSDVYSLASVCYEMLAGQPPHLGGSAQQIIMKIITEQAQSVTTLRKAVPPYVAAAVAKALEKLPADRFASALAFADALANPAFTVATTGASGATASREVRRLRTALAAASSVAGIALIFATWFAVRPPAGSADGITVTQILPPEGEDFSERNSFGALSPDGKRFAFVTLSSTGERRIWLRSLDNLQAEPLAGTTGAGAPFWSPDGKSLGFFSGGNLVRLDIGTEIPRRICSGIEGEWGSWGKSGIIVVSTARGIERVSAEGGTCEVVIPLDTFAMMRHPSLLPGDTRVLYEVAPMTSLTRNIYVGDLETGRSTLLMRDGVGPTYVAPGYLVFGRMGANGSSGLYAQRISADGETLEGEIVPLSGKVRTSGVVFSYSVSASGNLVYLPGLGDREKILVSRSGILIDTLRQAGSWTHRSSHTRPIVALGGVSGQLWLYDLRAGVSNLVKVDDHLMAASYPVWAPTDSAVVSGMCGVRMTSLSNRESRLLPISPEGCQYASDWSADGRTLFLIGRGGGIATYDLIDQRLDTLQEFGAAVDAVLSPDMRWLAVVSSEMGTSEVSVMPWGRPGRSVRVSRAGGRTPRWRRDGRELYFQTPEGSVMSVAFPADVAGALDGGSLRPTMLFRAEGWSRPFFLDMGTPYDASPDGQQFVLRLSAASAHAVLVQNWPALLRPR